MIILKKVFAVIFLVVAALLVWSTVRSLIYIGRYGFPGGSHSPTSAYVAYLLMTSVVCLVIFLLTRFGLKWLGVLKSAARPSSNVIDDHLIEK